MYFQQPVWFLLLIPLVCLFFVWRIPSRTLLVLRVLLLIFVILAMVGPTLLLPTRSGTVIVVADRSLSMPQNARDGQRHAINLLLEHIGKEDRLGVVSFGSQAYPEKLPGGVHSWGGKFGDFISQVQPDASNLSAAIETALALIPIGDKGRLLLLTDGRYTGENPNQFVSRLVQRGIAVDYRVMERPVVGDVAVISLDAPDMVNPKEVFKLVGYVAVPTSQEVEYELLRNGVIFRSGKREMSTGDNRLEFVLRADLPGALECTLRVKGTGTDPVPENNVAKKIIGVEGDKPVLLIAQQKENRTAVESKFAEVLRSAGIDTEVSGGSANGVRWSLPFLSNYSAIILENASSSSMGVPGMELVAKWVKETGTGLMMTGGKNSFALGGYYQSPLDDILPVSMELRKEHRKLAVAIAVVMDCSGSMGMVVPGGKIKMDLANLGTAEVVKTLTPLDEILVTTCDTSTQVIVPLKYNTTPDSDRQKILRTGPGGGGIFVGVALNDATQMLSKANAGTKHVILFTDADDTEKPDDVLQLLAKCQKIGMTCSVIALGREDGYTADLCKAIAVAGGGTIYFTEDATDLPRLFVQDTFTISRSTFIDEATPFHFTGSMTTLTGVPFTSPPDLGGYNLCYLKPGGSPAAVTEDEYTAPIIASWQAGLGRVLTYAAQVDGQYTGKMASWDRYNSMMASLGRWVAGRVEKLPNNMMLTQTMTDTGCKIELHLDPEQEGAPFSTPPMVTVLRQTPGMNVAVEKIPLRWLEPELLGTTVSLSGSDIVQATLLLTDGQGGVQPFSLPPACLPYSPEFRPSSSGYGRDILKNLASATGGVDRLELPGIWREIPKVPRYFDLSSWLLYAAAVVLVLEIFQRRTGWLSAWSNQILRGAANLVPTSIRKREPKEITEKSVSIFRRLAMRRERAKQTEKRADDSVVGSSLPSSSASNVGESPVSEATDEKDMFSALKKAKRSSQTRTKL